MRERDIRARTMPTSYIEYAARLLDERSGSTRPDQLISTGALAPRISVQQTLDFIAAARELDIDPRWYLDAARSIGAQLNGPVTLAMISAPTLGDGVDAFVRYMPDRVPYFRWEGVSRDGYFCCVLHELIDLGAARQTLIEFPLLMLREYLASLRGSAPQAARLQLAYPQPDYHARIESVFGCQVVYAATQNALGIPLSWRALRNAGTDNATWRVALARCEREAQQDCAHHEIEAIRSALQRHAQGANVGTPLPGLKQIASELRVSPRTVIRHLRSAGTSYQQLVDELQQQRAVELLAQPGLAIGEIALHLGFSDPSSFGRSFRRWTGFTPGQYRARALTQ